jgi:hypothetical protein
VIALLFTAHTMFFLSYFIFSYFHPSSISDSNCYTSTHEHLLTTSTRLIISFLSILFYIISASECDIIKKLPIFSTVKDPGSYIPLNPTDGTLQGNKKTTENPTTSTSTTTSSGDIFSKSPWKSYTAVCQKGTQAETFSRQFADVFASNILPPHITRYENASDLLLLEKIGVKVVSRSEYLRSEFLPIIGILMVRYPIETERVLVYILEDLKRLSEEDSGFVHDLKRIAFIPSMSISSNLLPSAVPSTSSSLSPPPSSPTPPSLPPLLSASTHTSHTQRLYKPYELFDPHCTDLVALLDPDRFPTHALHGNDTLQALRVLGLSTVLDFPDLIACAHSIAQAGQGILTGGSMSVEAKAVQKRGTSLLIYLNNNISRFLNHDSKDRYDQKEKEKEKEKNAFAMPSLLFGIRSLFVDKNTVKDSSPEVDIMKEYLEELKKVPWIPVHLHPTHPCMPWYATGTGTGTGTASSSADDNSNITSNDNGDNNSGDSTVLYREDSNGLVRCNFLAAAVDCRPMSDAWHCSASKRLVNDHISDSTSGPSSLILSPPLLQVQ